MCIEMDTEGTIPPDNDPPQPMGDPNTQVCSDHLYLHSHRVCVILIFCLQVTEEMEEKARELRSEAMMASAEGELEKAVELFTSAILANPKSALLYAKRARYYPLSLSLTVSPISPIPSTVSM